MLKGTAEFWEVFKATNGALSTAEALAIMNIAAQAPQGNYIELGTHKGKSALSAAVSLKEGEFILVDPIFDEAPEIFHPITIAWRELKFISEPVYSPNKSIIELEEGDVTDFAYCFVDSGLHDEMVMEEAKLLEDMIISKGIIAFHDYLNQFTAVERAYDYLLSTGKYEKIEINWQEIFDYVAEHNLEEGNNSWHQYPQLPHPPNFVGALRRK